MGLTCVVSAPLLLQLQACLRCTSLLQAYQPTSSPIKDSTAGMNVGNQMAVTLLLGSSAFELLLSLLLAYVETFNCLGFLAACSVAGLFMTQCLGLVAGAFALLSPADTSFGCLGILRDLPVWRRGTCCLVVLFASHLLARPMSQLLVEAYDAVLLGYSVLSSLPPYTFVIVLDVEYFCPFNAYRVLMLSPGKMGLILSLSFLQYAFCSSPNADLNSV